MHHPISLARITNRAPRYRSGISSTSRFTEQAGSGRYSGAKKRITMTRVIYGESLARE